ncbi:response regulator [bacterium]|nr:MAG: response regulator [bacterium]
MESSLIRVLPACLTQPLPRGWDASDAEYVFETMPGVDHINAVILALPTTEPDILLLDADWPDGDVFAVAAQALEARPTMAVVLLSDENAPDRLRRAMLAGAEEYLIRPIEAPALRESLIGIAKHRTLRVVDRDEIEGGEVGQVYGGLVVGVMSGKGGLGKTTLAVNMASVCSMAPNKSAGILGLESGDGAVMLSLQPKLGLLDLAGSMEERREGAGFALDWFRQFCVTHQKTGVYYSQWTGSGTQVPEYGVPEDFMPALLETCRRAHSVTFVDLPLLTPDEATAMFPLLDVILIVSSSSDLLALRSTKTFLDLIPEEIAPRVRVIINRSSPNDMISRDDFAAALDFKIAAVLPDAPQVAAQAINLGSPFVLTQGQSELALTVKQLAQVLFRLPVAAESKEKPRKRFMLF